MDEKDYDLPPSKFLKKMVTTPERLHPISYAIYIFMYFLVGVLVWISSQRNWDNIGMAIFFFFALSFFFYRAKRNTI
jgi:hypothetical protein